MPTEKPMKSEEIINLLSKLKNETPDYPAEMLAGRKAAFLKQAVNIKIDGKGQGGEGGQQGGGSGPASSGGTATPGMLLQALVGVSIVAAMLTAAFALREQIVEAIQGSDSVARDESSQPSMASTPLAPEATPAAPSLAAPAFGNPSSEIIETDPSVDLGNTNIDGASVAKGTPDPENASDKTKSNNGLHLGQTPGTPAAPGQGNPGNPNQPEKPDKPDKPDKSDKPDKPKK